MKFRAWDIINKKMLDWESIMHLTAREIFSDSVWPDTSDEEEPAPPKFVVMSYTGKHDICGTEVYEGDIIEDAGGRRLTVRYGKYWEYCPRSQCSMDSVGFYLEAPELPKMPIGPLNDYAKIVGNIFQS